MTCMSLSAASKLPTAMATLLVRAQAIRSVSGGTRAAGGGCRYGRAVLPRWQGGIAAAVVTALTLALIVLDLTDGSVRRFWGSHALTSDTVAGLLAVALTVLVVDQLVNRRHVGEQSRAIAAHAAIMLSQARRSVRATLSARDDPAQREAASDELRTYLLVLLVGAPVLIATPVARRFLEQAQALAGEMAGLLAPAGQDRLRRVSSGSVEDAVDRLRAAAAPLLAVLTPGERSAVAEDPA